ncbi:hypothetical protein BJ508DRAFT_313114 [Ascobolus immersus RN42]|uniref:Uncharacterized protein n=1 Tax=Ascobolus immersus RN42 TaxID=1160509 RepID=A0A3N4HX17_ASCIM|nr:hypothetical protein BJ508DRAFT_313114 [Ascobolus immersus RN42]
MARTRLLSNAGSTQSSPNPYRRKSTKKSKAQQKHKASNRSPNVLVPKNMSKMRSPPNPTPKRARELPEGDPDFFKTFATTPRPLTPPPPWKIPEHPFKIRPTSNGWGPVVVLGTNTNGDFMWHPERVCSAPKCIHKGGRRMKMGDRVLKCSFFTCSGWRHEECQSAEEESGCTTCISDKHLYTWGGDLGDYRRKYNSQAGGEQQNATEGEIDLELFYRIEEGISYHEHFS